MGNFNLKNFGGKQLNMLIAGVDEVGVGSICGPLLVCIAIFDDSDSMLYEIKDSKKLSHKQRVDASGRIKQRVVEYQFGWASPSEIDKYNTFVARDMAAVRAFEKVINKPHLIYMDGNHKVDYNNGIKQKALVRGDERQWQIGCASILAKLHRDKYMINISENRYDNKYDWSNNKGYYSPKHKEALLEYGVSPLHRMRFFSVGQALYERGEISKKEFESNYKKRH